MSEDKRKNLRTQGRFSSEIKEKSVNKDDNSKKSGIKSYSKERMQRNSPPDIKGDSSNDSTNSGIEVKQRNEDINASLPIYEENSTYASSFAQLKPAKKPIEIKNAGITVLSNTESGESRIFFKPDFMEATEAYQLHDLLLSTTEWCEKNIVIRGREVPQPRLVAWYGPFPYEYSGITLQERKMTPILLNIKKAVEKVLENEGMNVELNSVLLNRYRNGRDSVAWHSDDELTMGISPTIASVSLGETRKFEMKRKQVLSKNDLESKDDVDYFVHLKNGSLIVMDGVMQKDWQHQVPKEYHDKTERVNLTFRTVFPKNELPFRKLEENQIANHSEITESISPECDVKENRDDNFCPLSHNDTNTISYAEVLNQIDNSKSIPKEVENQSSVNEMNNLSKKEESVSNLKENEEVVCPEENNPDANFPAGQSFSKPDWPLAAINAPAFTSQNFNLSQVPDAPPYDTPPSNEEHEVSSDPGLNHSADPVAGNCGLEGFDQQASDGYSDTLQSEPIMTHRACLDIAKWYCSNQNSGVEDVVKYLQLFKDLPFRDLMKQFHFTKRDCDELRVLSTVAHEANALSDNCKFDVLHRMCTVITNADYYWSRDRELERVYNRNYEKKFKSIRAAKFNAR